jgi:ABC-2 type transport system ATP-binding protein
VLQLRGIAKAFRERRALAGVSLDVAAGEAVLLVGRNGAGKTTLLRIATGYIDADAGEVQIDGTPIADRARAQSKLGYLPEHAPAPGDLVVREHLTLRAHLKGVPLAAVERAIEAVGIGSEAERRIATLSKGYRQRVGLADALLGEPKLLVLDEPTSGLDPIQTKELRAQLVAAAKERAVLVSSHAVADLESMATRIAVLREGELIAVGSKAELCERAKAPKIEDAVVALMTGDAA